MTLGQLWLEYPDGGAGIRQDAAVLTDDENQGQLCAGQPAGGFGTLQTNFEEPLNQFSKALTKRMNGRMQELLQNPENLQNLLAGGIPDLVTEAFALDGLGSCLCWRKLPRPLQGRADPAAEHHKGAGRGLQAGSGVGESFR